MLVWKSVIHMYCTFLFPVQKLRVTSHFVSTWIREPMTRVEAKRTDFISCSISATLSGLLMQCGTLFSHSIELILKTLLSGTELVCSCAWSLAVLPRPSEYASICTQGHRFVNVEFYCSCKQPWTCNGISNLCSHFIEFMFFTFLVLAISRD